MIAQGIHILHQSDITTIFTGVLHHSLTIHFMIACLQAGGTHVLWLTADQLTLENVADQYVYVPKYDIFTAVVHSVLLNNIILSIHLSWVIHL